MDKNQPSGSGASNNSLNLLEGGCIFLSFLGSVGSVVTSQAVLAAAPLSFSLLLNLVNRRRIEQLTLHQSSATANQIQLVSEQLHILKQELLHKPVADNGEENTLLQTTYPPSDLDLSPIQYRISNLQDQYDSLQNTLLQINDQLGQPSATASTGDLEALLSSLATSLQEYEQRLTSLEQIPTSEMTQPCLSSDPAQLQAELQELISPLQSQLAALEAQVIQVASQPAPETSAIGSTVDPTQFQAEMQSQMVPMITPLQEQMAAVEVSLSSLSTTLQDYEQRLMGLEQHPASESVPATAFDPTQLQAEMQSQMVPMITPLQEQMAAVEAQLAQLQPSSAAAEPSENLDLQIQNLTSQVETTLNQLSTSVAVLPNAIQSAVQGQWQQSGQVEHLSTLKQQMDSLDLKLDITLGNLSGEIQALPALVEETVNKRLAEMPTQTAAQSSPQSSTMDELDQLLSDLDLGS